MANGSRIFDTDRAAQGFRSQAHLDTFYAYHDHVSGCGECRSLGPAMWLEGSASWQPTTTVCPEGIRLQRLSDAHTAGQPAREETTAGITIEHTHEAGTLVYGTERGDGSAEIFKACRFRWFPGMKLWGIPQSRDHLAKRWQIEQAAERLRAAGFAVTVEIDDTPRAVTEVKADRAERLEDRREALTAKAGRVRASSLAHLAAADAIAERRPFGQPIIVGHSSERGARADQQRIERHMDQFCPEYGHADELDRRASVVGQAEAYRERPAVIIRRIEGAEAELRKLPRLLAQHAESRAWRGEDPDPAYTEQLEAGRVYLEHQLAADRAALQAAEDAGYRRYTAADIHRGDKIRTRFGWHTVVRVSPKTVSVETPYSWTDKVSYERITGIECAHEQQAAMA